MNWEGKRVFLTGHTGFKGGWMTLALHSLGAKVFGYSLEPETDPSFFEALKLKDICQHKIGDVRSLENLKAAIERCQPEIVFHLAAQPLVRRSYRDPLETFSTNVMGTAHLLEACRNIETLKAVIVITTDKVYENKELNTGYKEDAPLGGHDPYSSSKACAELVATSYRKSFFGSKPVVTVRAGNIIGGGDWSEDRLIPDAARAFNEGRPVSIRNPRSVRPWQHVLEPVRGYLMLAEAVAEKKTEHMAFNFGPNEDQCVPVEKVITRFCSAWPGSKWETVQLENQPKETNVLMLDSTRVQRAIDWHPVLSLDQSLDMTAEWYRTFYEGASANQLRELSLQQLRKAGVLGQRRSI